MAIFPAAGNTQISSFIPEVWAALLMAPLHEELVLGSDLCTNRDYEGDIAGPGDQVHINSLVRPAVVGYTRNADVLPELLDTDRQTLAIDHGKAFAFILDDVDAVQQAQAGTDKPHPIYAATLESMQALKVAADSYVGTKMVAGALADNKKIFKATGSSPGDPFNALVDYGVVLDNADVPVKGRFAVVRPEVKALILKHDKFIASSYGSAEPIQNGVIGSLAGFTVAVTPHMPTGVNMIVGSPIATTYGDQLSKLEAIRHPTKFGDVVRGLHVAGAKVIRPEALIIASES
ncbi:N4-gp56 family major capsid protein [Nonomuraea sp. NN258]|uniref:N4-gp56 family major capsid protein n=1 Tax=Nonomuraea antri TaxID=2730852 RepID=UPI001568D6BB|nr:N4-gp56 family major capsid protein [Nonomuraea antri]NRQ38267.1 N4-gp56 family major capsid protein [Nonomuraea antri]